MKRSLFQRLHALAEKYDWSMSEAVYRYLRLQHKAMLVELRR